MVRAGPFTGAIAPDASRKWVRSVMYIERGTSGSGVGGRRVAITILRYPLQPFTAPRRKKPPRIKRKDFPLARLQSRERLVQGHPMSSTLQATDGKDAFDSATLFLRLPAVMKLTGLGRSTIYRMVADRRFPGPVRIASRAVAWRRSDLDRWSQSCPNVTH
jgi:prophage regulatory protein